MHLLNLTLGQFLALFGSVSAVMLALYLLDRSRRRQVVSTLRFWVSAEQPTVVARRRRIQQPFSLLLQLASIALLLLAIAQLRLGMPASAPRDHVLILDTSAWMAARTSTRTLMDLARDRARAYVRAVPARDRILLVRADALTTPATAFEPDRQKLEEAIARSEPGATALNLDQALAFARQIQAQSGRRAGEVVFVGTGKLAEREPGKLGLRNLRFLSVPDAVDNCGLRRIGVRRSAADSDVWEIYVSVRNYGAAHRHARADLRPLGGWSRQFAGRLPAHRARTRRRSRNQLPVSQPVTGLSAGADSAARRLPRRRSRDAAIACPAGATRDGVFRRAGPAAPRAGRQPAGGGHFSRALRIQRASPRIARNPGPLPSAHAPAGRFHLDRSAGGRISRAGARARFRCAPHPLAHRSSVGRRFARQGPSPGIHFGFRSGAGRSEDRRGGRGTRDGGASRQAEDRRAGLSSGAVGDAL